MSEKILRLLKVRIESTILLINHSASKERHRASQIVQSLNSMPAFICWSSQPNPNANDSTAIRAVLLTCVRVM